MLNLIRLEWKKNNIGKYIRNAAIMTFVLLFFIVMYEILNEYIREQYSICNAVFLAEYHH